MRSQLTKALARSWRDGTRHKLQPFPLLSLLLLCGLVVGLAGCGGGSAAPSTSAPAPNVSVLLQDAPADGVAAFSIDVTNLSFKSADGQAIALSSSGQAMEVRHMQLSPTVAFQGFAPQTGTYKSLSFSVSNPQLTVLNASGHIARINTHTTPAAILATSTVTVPMTVMLGNPGRVNLMLDLDLAHSISNDKYGNYIITPVVHASVLGGASPAKIRGALAAVTAMFFNGPNVLSQVPINALDQGTSNQQYFEVQLHDSGQAVPIAVASSTVIDGAIGNLSNLHLGQLIYVSADIQSNGTLLASSIAAGPPNQSQHYQGPVTRVYKDSSGKVSFDVVVQN